MGDARKLQDVYKRQPTTLTVADFLSLRMQYKAEQTENEIPAVIEHNFKDGRIQRTSGAASHNGKCGTDRTTHNDRTKGA